MIRRNSTFQDATNDFSALKSRFIAFCELCQKSYTDNDHFPSVSFELKNDRATLHAFDRVFEFTIALCEERLGIMRVLMADECSENQKNLLAHWYFSIDGNVKASKDDDSWNMHPFVSLEFMQTVSNTIAANYMAHIDRSHRFDE